MKNIKIVELTEEDFYKAYEVFKVTVPYAFDLSEDVLCMEVVEDEIESKKKVLESALNRDKTGVIVLIAKNNDEVVGTISFGPCSEAIRQCTNNEFSNVGELGSLFILPKYQDKGIGSALIEEMISYLEKRGIKEFCLDSGYKDAQKRWCRKFGNPYKIVKDYWAPGIDNMVWLCKI